jgi:hypothetical protein
LKGFIASQRQGGIESDPEYNAGGERVGFATANDRLGLAGA